MTTYIYRWYKSIKSLGGGQLLYPRKTNVFGDILESTCLSVCLCACLCVDLEREVVGSIPGSERPKSVKLVVVDFSFGAQDYSNSTTTGRQCQDNGLVSWLVVLGFNTTLTAKVISWRSHRGSKHTLICIKILNY